MIALASAVAAGKPSRATEAAAYLLASSSATADEQRLATEAIEWLRAAGGKAEADCDRCSCRLRPVHVPLLARAYDPRYLLSTAATCSCLLIGRPNASVWVSGRSGGINGLRRGDQDVLLEICDVQRPRLALGMLVFYAVRRLSRFGRRSNLR